MLFPALQLLCQAVVLYGFKPFAPELPVTAHVDPSFQTM